MLLRRKWPRLFWCLLLVAVSSPLKADDTPTVRDNNRINVEQLADSARDSLVAVTVQGRDGKQQGMGSGFVISPEGLIATNMHVVGEARPIQVQFPNGKQHDVQVIYASDRALDLAILKIDAEKLPALPLRKRDDSLRQGEPVAVLGNPQGLKFSVVSGVVSGVRERDGRKMIQLAVPVEPGNSGGPVLDADGRVVGIITMKSLITENLGFAVKVDDLQTLIDKPNPIPMERWLTIGALNNKQWTTLFGARWQQRAGRLLVSGAGEGFGGRSLCLLNDDVPRPPFEIGVNVRLDDESGAAGLVFHSDGENKHYGFYPSGGKLRLSRFDGPNVFSWKVLEEVGSPHYRPGEWNHLKVRVGEEKLQCYVNDQLVIESTDDRLSSGKVGLAKFRHTEAEFKDFRIGRELPRSQLPQHLVDRLSDRIEELPALEKTRPELLSNLTRQSPASVKVMRQKAAALKRRAEELERLASDVHVAATVSELGEELDKAEEEIDVLRAALLVAKLDNHELDVAAYSQHVEQMAADVRNQLPEKADAPARLAALNQYLFRQNGFHGSRTDYYHRANSYLNRVIDDREGLPITLSVLYMELARRLDLTVVGVGLPGHFVVRHEPSEAKPQLIDVFDRGKKLSREAADDKVRELTGEPLEDAHLAAYTKRQIIRRMLQNLLGVAQQADDREAMLRYTEAMVGIDPEDIQSRGLRAVMRFQTGRRAAAVADLDWILDKRPEGIDLEELRAMREHFATANLPN